MNVTKCSDLGIKLNVIFLKYVLFEIMKFSRLYKNIIVYYVILIRRYIIVFSCFFIQSALSNPGLHNKRND